MSTNNSSTSCSARSGSKRRRPGGGGVSQTPIDAKLHEEFEEKSQHKQFDYSNSVNRSTSTSTSNVPSSSVSAYLQKMQRGSLIQPFGCLIAIDEQNFKVLAFSENTPEMLDLSPHAVPNMDKQQEPLAFGTDLTTLFRFSSVSALHKAAKYDEVSFLNPILVHSVSSGKPFYAILHRIDVGLVIDLEPVNIIDVPVTAAGALKSYKLSAKSISRLQSLPSGNISLLCDVLVKEVSELTGYDRVMVYKFHEDEHGEVISEIHKPDLEPYLGLHYPAIDIPQASRFLFMKNKVRMICDCLAQSVKVVQDPGLGQPLSLAGSTLRAPHGCHSQYMANMGSIASLVMSVTISDEDEESGPGIGPGPGTKLWGLVVCHHTSPRFLPFPLRYACEFLIQVFSVQINKEVELSAQRNEKNILQTQTVLCDMLLRDAPLGIITQSPNVMDLVKCDGAALFYRGKTWLLGVTPDEGQIRHLVKWLLDDHTGSTGLSTDSLTEAGYPRASLLGDAICGMAAVRITTQDFLFWFRSHTAKEIKWGGAKHDPGDKDNTRKMHPRSSFKAFLEVVKHRSLPWEDVEMDAIHSLQLILRGSLQDQNPESSKMIINVPNEEKGIERIDELRVVTSEMVRLIETATIPIFAVDMSGNINGWNDKVCELTYLSVEKAIGMSLLDLVVDDSINRVNNMLSSVLKGVEEKNIEIQLKSHDPERKNDDPIILVANACCNRDAKSNIIGVCFVGQDVTGQKLITDKYMKVQGDYIGIVSNPCALIPPIFMTDENGRCIEWSDSMRKLTGLTRDETVNQMLLGEVFTVNSYGCQVKDQDTLTKLRILLNRVISGEEVEKLLFGFYDQEGKFVEAFVSASRRVDSEGKIVGVLCFLHVASPELQYAIQIQKISEKSAENSLTKLSYIRTEIKNPLNGIKCIQDFIGSTNLSKEQSQILTTSQLCCEQLAKILEDADIESIEESYTDVGTTEFKLKDSLDAVINQVMIIGQEREVQIIFDSPPEISSIYLYGDTLRLQQVLANFLKISVIFTPAFEGASVLFKIIPRKERIGSKIHIIHIEFRITHPAPGIPEKLIQEMFYQGQNVSREGLGLYLSQKLVKIMNGTVQYLREAERSSFIILVEFPLVHRSAKDAPQRLPIG